MVKEDDCVVLFPSRTCIRECETDSKQRRLQLNPPTSLGQKHNPYSILFLLVYRTTSPSSQTKMVVRRVVRSPTRSDCSIFYCSSSLAPSCSFRRVSIRSHVCLAASLSEEACVFDLGVDRRTVHAFNCSKARRHN